MGESAELPSEIQVSSKERSQELLQTKNNALDHFVMFLLLAISPLSFLFSQVLSHGLPLTTEYGKGERMYIFYTT